MSFRILWDEEDTAYILFDDDLFNECTDQVDSWLEDPSKVNRPFHKKTKEYWELKQFASMCLKKHGFVEEYADVCIENNMGLRMQMIRTLATLKTWKPNREFSFEEVQMYTNIYDLVAALTDVAEGFEDETGKLMGEKVREIDIEEALFKPDKLIISENHNKEKKKVTPASASIKKSDIKEEDYIAEIENLRKKLHEKEQDNKYLREQYRDAKHLSEERENLVKKYERERDELIALREYAYNSEHFENTVEVDDLPAIKEELSSRKIVIIGGHENWQSKLKLVFPEWFFVHPDAYKTVNATMLEDKEKVFFFTDYINHISYKKFIAVVREKNIPFGYIGSQNIESVIRQIHREI